MGQIVNLLLSNTEQDHEQQKEEIILGQPQEFSKRPKHMRMKNQTSRRISSGSLIMRSLSQYRRYKKETTEQEDEDIISY